MTPLLEVRSVSKNFGALKVIDNVSFSVPEKGRTALIGPNGAGKTTIFNLISGFYDVSSGSVLLGGTDITGIPSRKRVGLGKARSFQNIRLMPHLSVVENVMLGQQSRAGGLLQALLPLRASHLRGEAEALLESMNIRVHPDDVVSSLPYGIRKQIEVVRALASKPRLLLLDEPAAGLNPAETAALVDFLRKISDSGVTLLVVEHDMSLVRSLCDHSVVLNFGRKIYDGATAHVHEDPQVLEAYLGPGRAGTAGLSGSAA